jgi:hypothetical protein
MKQRILIASTGAAVIIVVAAIIFATTQASETYSNKLECTDSAVIIYFEPSTIGVPPSAQTETTVTSYTTTTNSTATVGYTTLTNFTQPFTNANEVIMRSCTYIKNPFI